MNTFSLFSLPITYGQLSQLTSQLLRSAKQKKQQTLLPITMNEVVMAKQDGTLTNTLNDFTLLVPDGMPLVWLLRMKGKKTDRLYGPDIMFSVLKASQNTSLKHFLYGSSPATLERLLDKINNQFPKAKIVGSYAPPFRALTKREKKSVTARFKKSQADFIWVSLGGKKQADWIGDWQQQLPHSTFIAVGAAFDFIAGSKKQAPPWLQTMGLEWLFRLIQEPRRLGKRYLGQLPAALLLFIKEALKHE